MSYISSTPCWPRSPGYGMGRYGLGDTSVIPIAAAGASSTLGILTAVGAIGGPLGAALGAGVSLAASLVSALNQGCGQTCVIATDYANKGAEMVKQNTQTYLALPAPRTPAQQAAALANFDAIWQWLNSSQGCGNPQLGDAGTRCISERDRSGKYTWFYWRDLIANDTQVQSTPASAVASAVSAVTGSGAGINPLALAAIAAVVLVAVMA